MFDTVKARDLEQLLEFDFRNAVEALDHHARNSGDRRAVTYGETGLELSYAEFGRLTDNIAGNLAARGVGERSKVSVLTPNPLIATLTMYGLWKLGATYAPLNFQFTGDLLAYQLNDINPELLLVDRQLENRISELGALLPESMTTIVADDLATGGFAELLAPATRPNVRIDIDLPASIIYTSGTTGPAKGVVQSHRWLNIYTWMPRKTLTPDDVLYNDLPTYHIAGAHICFARALWAGAAVSLWDRFSPSDFWHRINSTGCTTAVLLDVMIPWLLNAEPTNHDRENPLNKVHLQPLPANHKEFATRFGIDFTTSGFGQSESGLSLLALTEQCPEGQGTPSDLYRGHTHEHLRELFTEFDLPVFDGKSELPKGSMGKPLPFAEVTVLDERDRECAPGEVGQLAIRPRLCEALFQEYLGKPAATVHAWRNLWFHTGDAATRDADGQFSFIDRLGDRLRVRGENISGFHIEEILIKHPSVQLAAVVAIPGAEGNEDDVIAFVELSEGELFDPGQLAEHCREHMPKYMRPRDFIAVDQLPRTPTNKIEKYRLRDGYLREHRS
ncbi:class I adenylate-forming enzyme family protein [Gordonia sp. VNK21]|uniref:class I adenylate-forming enzyme family protein n=1 Tax=Gordonia sp. VNK21 TaxID=3382483 RepID=UPI0038D4E070